MFGKNVELILKDIRGKKRTSKVDIIIASFSCLSSFGTEVVFQPFSSSFPESSFVTFFSERRRLRHVTQKKKMKKKRESYDAENNLLKVGPISIAAFC